MELMPGFKSSDAGPIPVDWECVAIADVARLESGHTPSKRVPAYWNGDVPWVSLHDSRALEENEISETAKTITELGLQNSSARLLPAGTVVFSRTATVGKASIIAKPMATSQDFANYVCGPKLHNRYLMYLFRYMKPRWRRLMAGSIHNTIYMPVFETLRIAYPPIREQVAIAEVLADKDAEIDGVLLVLEKKRALKHAAMQQLLSGRIRLEGRASRWREASLNDVVSRSAGYWGQAQRSPMRTRKVSVIRAGDVDSEGRLVGTADRYFTDAEYAKAKCERGDVIVTGSGSVGKVWWCDGRPAVAASNFVRVLRPVNDAVDGKFLSYLLRSDHAQRVMYEHVATGVLANLGTTFFTSAWMRLPSLDEQLSIAAVLSDMDAEIAALEARLEKTRALKQAMMQELLTGRTRLA